MNKIKILLFTIVLCIIFITIFIPQWSKAENIDKLSLEQLNTMATKLNKEGRYLEAVPLENEISKRDGTKKIIDNYIYNKDKVDHSSNEEKISKAKHLYNIGTFRIGPEDNEYAIKNIQESLEIYENVLGPKHPTVGVVARTLAKYYMNVGAYDKALPLCERALSISETTHGSNHPDVATSLNVLAQLYYKIGDYDKALPLSLKSLKVAENILGDDNPELTYKLSTLGLIYTKLGSYGKALSLFERALKITNKPPGAEDTIFYYIGCMHFEMKNFIKADEYFTKSHYSIGRVEIALARGKNEEAQMIIQGLSLDNQMYPTLTNKITLDTVTGTALMGSDKRVEGAFFLLKAVQGIEELRTRISGEKGGLFQASMGGPGYIRAYRNLVTVLADISLRNEKLSRNFKKYGDNSAEAAFFFSESTKARALLEAIAQSALKNKQVKIPKDMRQKEDYFFNQFNALNVQLEKESRSFGKGEKSKSREKKEQVTAEFNRFLEGLRKDYPAYASLHYPQPVLAKDLPLKDQEVLIEYALGEKISTLFVVRKNSVVKVIPIPYGRDALAEKVNTFMEPLLNTQGKNFLINEAKELYEILLAKALEGVKKTDEVLIVPDGILGLLPFEVLVEKQGSNANDSQFVGDRYSIRYYQSAAVLALQRILKEQNAPKPLFALGNPVFGPDDERIALERSGKKSPVLLATKMSGRGGYRVHSVRKELNKISQEDNGQGDVVYLPLPETEIEVRNIASLFGVQASPPDILLNIDASENRLKEVPLKDYRYIHFATHADSSGEIQGIKEPFILLGQVNNTQGNNGFLTMSKVLGLDLSADMVVLSACLTGRGKVVEGEGVANFARAFQHAGAKSVLVSLWAVASKPAVEYMELLYGNLKNGRTRSEALRLARNEIKIRYPNPFIWAPFILHGEG